MSQTGGSQPPAPPSPSSQQEAFPWQELGYKLLALLLLEKCLSLFWVFFVCGCSDLANQTPADVEGSGWEGKCCEKNPGGFLAQESKGRSKALMVGARLG